jgi:hypothetical protein
MRKLPKPDKDLTNEKPEDYKCPSCDEKLTEHPGHVRQPLMFSMYCENDGCPIVRIKIFTVS